VIIAAGSALAALLVGWLVFFVGSQLDNKPKIQAFKAIRRLCSGALIVLMLVPALLVYVQAGFPLPLDAAGCGFELLHSNSAGRDDLHRSRQPNLRRVGCAAGRPQEIIRGNLALPTPFFSKQPT
jgi:hypothetical protein